TIVRSIRTIVVDVIGVNLIRFRGSAKKWCPPDFTFENVMEAGTTKFFEDLQIYSLKACTYIYGDLEAAYIVFTSGANIDVVGININTQFKMSDDIIITGNNETEINNIKEYLRSKFKIKDLGKLKYFLGIEVLEIDDGFCLNQRKYCLELFSEYGILACNNLVSWKSKKQNVLAKSLAEAKYRAMNSVTCEVLWIIKFLNDLRVDVNLPAPLRCDSTYAFQIAANPVFHERTKHFEIDLCSNWNPIIKKFSSKLSSWKARLLSVGGRLSVIKLVLGNLPTYYMSLYLMPVSVRNKLEAMRNKFFIGGDQEDKKVTCVKWKKCMASKEHGGLGIGSIFGFNTGLLFKWIWSFKNNSWDAIIHSIHDLKNQASKVSLVDWNPVLRREPRGGSESAQLNALKDAIGNVCLSDKRDSWTWSLDGCNNFSVASVRLPSRVNLDQKGIDTGSTLCPICSDDIETSNHIFFNCGLAQDLWASLAKWWELDIPICSNISESYDWLDSSPISSKDIRRLLVVLHYLLGLISFMRGVKTRRLEFGIFNLIRLEERKKATPNTRDINLGGEVGCMLGKGPWMQDTQWSECQRNVVYHGRYGCLCPFIEIKTKFAFGYNESNLTRRFIRYSRMIDCSSCVYAVHDHYPCSSTWTQIKVADVDGNRTIDYINFKNAANFISSDLDKLEGYVSSLVIKYYKPPKTSRQWIYYTWRHSFDSSKVDHKKIPTSLPKKYTATSMLDGRNMVGEFRNLILYKDEEKIWATNG
nr:RNA-directed DNA polymerase, eukaryota, reverse transcriptase zinc-binding domain protein [Tanacetum cinerariifolium]